MRYVITVVRTPGREQVTGVADEYSLPLDERETRRVLIDALEILADERATSLSSSPPENSTTTTARPS